MPRHKEEEVMVQEVDQTTDTDGEGRVGGRQGGFFFNLPPDITAKLEEFSAREERTPRGQVQYIVRQWVKMQEMKEKELTFSFNPATYGNQSGNGPSSTEQEQ